MPYIELKTLRAETPRSVNIPNVIVSRVAVPFIVFHARVIRPAIFEVAKKDSMNIM